MAISPSDGDDLAQKEEDAMEYTTFGKTGLKVSVAGLGCGGNSRLGLGTGRSEEEAIAIVRNAVDLGVNILDTAANYKTEELVGKAIKPLDRESLIIATKSSFQKDGAFFTADQVIASLENSLRELDTDYIDVFQLHAVPPKGYDHALNVLAPVLEREKEKGRIRHIGLTETSPRDHGHEMLQRAVHDPVWESMMLGFNMMHQKARQKVFPHAIENNVGTLLMFVVRNIFSQEGYLANTMRELAEAGLVSADLAKSDNPLDFLIHEGGATSLTDAAYRFVRHQPGVSVVLFGTGSQDHLRTNIESIVSPPLPEADVAKLHELFGHLEGVGLDLPDRSQKKA